MTSGRRELASRHGEVSARKPSHDRGSCLKDGALGIVNPKTIVIIVCRHE